MPSVFLRNNNNVHLLKDLSMNITLFCMEKWTATKKKIFDYLEWNMFFKIHMCIDNRITAHKTEKKYANKHSHTQKPIDNNEIIL